MKPRKSRHGNVLRWLERLLWLAAIAALGAFVFNIADGRIYQWRLNEKFDEARAAEQVQDHAVQDAVPEQVAKETTAVKSAPAAARPDPQQPSLGRLQIPRLAISVMLLDGVDGRSLRRGIGHIPGTALPGQAGNMAVAGHRDTFLRGLAGIHRNDRITIETLGGEYEYVVDSIRIVDPRAVQVLKDVGHPALTLVTCYPFNFVGPAPKRFVVQASLTKSGS